MLAAGWCFNYSMVPHFYSQMNLARLIATAFIALLL